MPQSQSQSVRYTSGAQMPIRRPGRPVDIQTILAMFENNQQPTQAQPQINEAQLQDILRRMGITL